MKKKDRLLELFNQIKDEKIKNIISDVVALEREHRMSSSENFPRQKIRDIIDREFRIQKHSHEAKQ